jgi:pimeloyl-[acyl-carrier protein] methyl ester esterase
MSECVKEVACVFVHGWAMNSAVWQPLLQNLPDWIEPRLVDLPGHGALASQPADSLFAFASSVAASISNRVDRPCLWVGWSLGGLVAMQVAKDFPQHVAGLMLVASSPKFVCGDDWSTAVERQVFDQFAEALEQDVDRTIKRFLMLQAMGMPDAAASKQTVRGLQQLLETGGRASMHGLRSGLEILAGADLRYEFSALDMPVTCVLGERDTLAPAGLAAPLTALNPRARIEIIDGAAHAPFISHRDTFIRILIHHAEQLRR